jgi:hypothetical protein
MISNDLSEIFFALKYYHDKNLPLHIKIASISLISKKLCNNTFMTSLNEVVKVFKEVTIDNVISLNVYENPSFCCTLFVFKNGTLTPWLTLKFSSIKNSVLGVFSSQKFKKNEFITFYLSEVDENPSDETYTFKKINGKPIKSASGLLEDYWFGHQIQHGSIIKSMFLLLQGILSRQVKTLKLVKNFLWITIDLYSPENVKMKLIFMINVPRSLRGAIFVEMYA